MHTPYKRFTTESSVSIQAAISSSSNNNASQSPIASYQIDTPSYEMPPPVDTSDVPPVIRYADECLDDIIAKHLQWRADNPTKSRQLSETLGRLAKLNEKPLFNLAAKNFDELPNALYMCLLDGRADANGDSEKASHYAVHYAAQMGQLGVIHGLRAIGGEMSIRDAYEKRPITYAAAYGNVSVARYLIESGAAVDYSVRWNAGGGRDLLAIAC